ncbi:MAG: IS1595 family transposase [Phenylobacterium sp.]|uniref:IS1595 family transposase n=1 Tax=Phenylobacterium sp. TaxID=1871053 RepID=UPI00391D4592
METKPAPQPKTLMEAVRYFADADRTLAMAVELRWPEGVHCPTCGRTDVRFLSTRRIWECKEKHPKRQFSAKVGTIFEDSALPLDKWFVAIWAVANCKNGISSYELARAVGVTQKSAWFMLHRIRIAMDAGSPTKMGGIVEADETFIGGLAKNMHERKRKQRVTAGGGDADKMTVMGLIQRGDGKVASRVHARVIRDRNAKAIQGVVREMVEPGSMVFSDSHMSYRGLSADYFHAYVNHAVEYVRGHVSSNGVENFWSLLKRTVKGTYVSVDPHHLNRYLGEQAFRFNERKDNDLGRFRNVLGSVAGKRLTWKDLTNHALSPAF